MDTMKNYLLMMTLCCASPVYSMSYIFSWISQQNTQTKLPVTAPTGDEEICLDAMIRLQQKRRIDEGNEIAELQNFLPFATPAEKINSHRRIAEILESQLQNDTLSNSKRKLKVMQLRYTRAMIRIYNEND